MSPASATDPSLVGPAGGGLVAAVAAVAIAVDRLITGRRRERSDIAKDLAQRTTDLMAAAVAMADERRQGEHECHERLDRLGAEMADAIERHKVELAVLAAKVDECERKHAEVAAKLEHGGYPEQHGP